LAWGKWGVILRDRRQWVRFAFLVLIVAGTFYLGAVLGYLQGRVDGANAPVNGVSKVAVLRSLRKGDIAMAILLLETELDGNLVYQGVSKDKGRSVFDAFGLCKYDEKFLQRISWYRRSVTYAGENAEVNRAVSIVLRRYSTGQATKTP
jgi:hypothetical protein